MIPDREWNNRLFPIPALYSVRPIMTGRFWPIDDRLRHWHPVVPENRVTGKPIAIQCCGVPIVLFRSGGEGIAAIYNRCAHRRMPLSHGTVGPQG